MSKVYRMVAKISVKGRMVIPEAIREQARLRKGDELDVGYANGLIVMRKRQPLNAARVRKMLLAGSRLPEMTSEDEAAVERAIQQVRRQR
jgi:AbrB family looped-hinge helix DNA binding protein